MSAYERLRRKDDLRARGHLAVTQRRRNATRGCMNPPAQLRTTDGWRQGLKHQHLLNSAGRRPRNLRRGAAGDAQLDRCGAQSAGRAGVPIAGHGQAEDDDKACDPNGGTPRSHQRLGDGLTTCASRKLAGTWRPTSCAGSTAFPRGLSSLAPDTDARTGSRTRIIRVATHPAGHPGACSAGPTTPRARIRDTTR
jgi:hypothetical protein